MGAGDDGAAADGGDPAAIADRGAGGRGVDDLYNNCDEAATGSSGQEAGAGAGADGGGADDLRTGGGGADGGPSPRRWARRGAEGQRSRSPSQLKRAERGKGGKCSPISGAAGGGYSAAITGTGAGGGGVRGPQAEHRRAVEWAEAPGGGGGADGGSSQLGGAGHGMEGGRLHNTAPPGGGRSSESEAESGTARGPAQDYAEWDRDYMQATLEALRQVADGLYAEAFPGGDGSGPRANAPAAGAAVCAPSDSLEGGGGATAAATGATAAVAQ